jgi:hypothetical protein
MSSQLRNKALMTKLMDLIDSGQILLSIYLALISLLFGIEKRKQYLKKLKKKKRLKSRQ